MSAAPSSPSLQDHLHKKTFLFGLKLWVVIGILVASSILAIFLVLILCAGIRSRKRPGRFPAGKKLLTTRQPTATKGIVELKATQLAAEARVHMTAFNSAWVDKMEVSDNYGDKDDESADSRRSDAAFINHERPTNGNFALSSPLTGLPDFSNVGWGHRFTQRDLELATSGFSRDNIVGEGGYGVVYWGKLINGTPVAVKKLFNNL